MLFEIAPPFEVVCEPFLIREVVLAIGCRRMGFSAGWGDSGFAQKTGEHD